MIVIVTYPGDLTADFVKNALSQLGRDDVFLLELEKAHEKYEFSWQASDTRQDWTLRSRLNPETPLTSENISSIYWRRVAIAPGTPMLGLPTSDNLDDFEIFWSLRWLLESMPDNLFPLGHPHSHACAENKHRQITAARKVGFRIPSSCHSNDSTVLSQFIAAQEQIALKAMRVPALTRTGNYVESRHIACKAFAPEFLLEKLKEDRRTQLFCQKAIQRKRDLRIMVFPHTTIAAEIDTTKLPDNKLDWREFSLDAAHEIVPISPEFDKQMREYLALMNINVGYFDFAVPEDGPPIFFECNTNAQWLWIEKVTGYPISEAIARELISQSA